MGRAGKMAGPAQLCLGRVMPTCEISLAMPCWQGLGPAQPTGTARLVPCWALLGRASPHATLG